MKLQKWRVNIPMPSAKRMQGNSVLIVTGENGWGDGFEKKFEIDKKTVNFEFEINASYEYVGGTKTLDTPTFSVEIKYTNSTGTRSETIQLVPEKL